MAISLSLGIPYNRYIEFYEWIDAHPATWENRPCFGCFDHGTDFLFFLSLEGIHSTTWAPRTRRAASAVAGDPECRTCGPTVTAGNSAQFNPVKHLAAPGSTWDISPKHSKQRWTSLVGPCLKLYPHLGQIIRDGGSSKANLLEWATGRLAMFIDAIHWFNWLVS